jgi:hypothetical protein
LDDTIGEYDAMTRVEGVKFERLGLFQSKKAFKTPDDLKAKQKNTRSLPGAVSLSHP